MLVLVGMMINFYWLYYLFFWLVFLKVELKFLLLLWLEIVFLVVVFDGLGGVGVVIVLEVEILFVVVWGIEMLLGVIN